MQPIEAGAGRADSVIIQSATSEDLPGILEIYNHAVLHTTATYDYEPRTLEHRREWYEQHCREGLPVFVAFHPKAGVVGWSALNRYHDRPGYQFTCENSVYVAADWRGCGIGGRLLSPLVDSARRLGKRAILAVIDAENSASIRLHSAHGFVVSGQYRQVGFKFNRWLDLTVMQCLLEGPG